MTDLSAQVHIEQNAELRDVSQLVLQVASRSVAAETARETVLFGNRHDQGAL